MPVTQSVIPIAQTSLAYRDSANQHLLNSSQEFLWRNPLDSPPEPKGEAHCCSPMVEKLVSRLINA